MNAGDVRIVMRKLNEAMQALTDEQIHRIARGEAAVEITLVSARPKVEPKENLDVADWLNKLQGMKDRGSGVELLSELGKPLLQALARDLDLAVDKATTKERLIERIVERSIGLRLRRDAFAQIT
jgi:hypothetical protein